MPKIHYIKISVDVWTYKDASQAVINAARRGVQVDIVVGDTTGEAFSENDDPKWDHNKTRERSPL